MTAGRKKKLRSLRASASGAVKVLITTYDGNPQGWRAHGRNARGQADHEKLAHIVG